MIAEYNQKSLMFGVPGFLLQAVCGAAARVMSEPAGGGPPTASASTIGLLQLGTLAGAVLLVIGLCYYAKGKGYNPLFGLLGLLSCIGILILAVMPDKST